MVLKLEAFVADEQQCAGVSRWWPIVLEKFMRRGCAAAAPSPVFLLLLKLATKRTAIATTGTTTTNFLSSYSLASEKERERYLSAT